MMPWESLRRGLLLCLCVSIAAGEVTAVAAQDDTPFGIPYGVTFPSSVTYKASVMTNIAVQAKPLAYYDQNYTSSPEEPFAEYRGFQPDLLRAMVRIAKELDNVTLTFELEEAPLFTYGLQIKYMSTDCNITAFRDIPIPKEDCDRLDLIIGDFYAWPDRSITTPLSPLILQTAAAALQYTGRQRRQISTLAEAQALGEPVCLLDDSWHDKSTLQRYPRIQDKRCFSHEECVRLLKSEECALFVDDDLQLKHMVVQDPDLRMAPDSFDSQDIVWPFHHRLPALKRELLVRWILQAKLLGIVDKLYDKYFSVAFCPIGKAGVNCDQACSPTRGLADRRGVCVCESTKWTGSDCDTEVVENLNTIPTALKIISYIMVAINFGAVAGCAGWLWRHKNTAQVQVAQPLFLCLILVGCLISSSTIFALAQEDEGSGSVPACMAIPWLYSVGFCITFGTLLAKIRRVWLLFVAAANMERVTVTARETFSVIGLVLLVDLTILVCWTAISPLEWERSIVTADKYNEPLESEGHCTGEYWAQFGIAIALFHLFLLLAACYMCYVSRDIPTQFSEGKYVSIAMVSNLQIFVVGVPVLVIIGNDPQTSFFVRSVMIFINDLAVIALIFGNLILSVYVGGRRRERPSTAKSLVRNGMRSFARRKVQRESQQLSSTDSKFVSNTTMDGSSSNRHGVEGQGPFGGAPHWQTSLKAPPSTPNSHQQSRRRLAIAAKPVPHTQPDNLASIREASGNSSGEVEEEGEQAAEAQVSTQTDKRQPGEEDTERAETKTTQQAALLLAPDATVHTNEPSTDMANN